MSHYTGHLSSSPLTNPKGRVGLIGAALVGTGLLGFFAFLQRKHEQKHLIDKTYGTGKVSTWESRMIQRNFPSADPSNPATLRAARIENRTTPLPTVKTQHDAHHRTLAQERAQQAAALQNGHDEAMSASRSFEVPTAQRNGDGGFVYTKKPLWYQTGKVDFMNGRSKPSSGASPAKNDTVLNDVVRGAEDVLEDVKETVKGAFRK